MLPLPKVMLVGATGTGKTHSARTLVGTGVTPFLLFTEPGMETINDIPCPDLHWCYVPPAAPSWADMLDSANKINTMSIESLSKMSDINKRKYSQFMDVLKALSNFTCSRCGTEFGPVDNWATDRALFLDSMSGLSVMAMNLVVGSKPTKSPGDWNMAMDNLERLVTKLCTDLDCMMVLTAHLERETDEVTGGVQLMASTLGKKLAPKLPRYFSDVIHAKREGKLYSWATDSLNVDLKARNLALGSGLPPSFVPILESWKKRGGTITKSLPSGGASV